MLSALWRGHSPAPMHTEELERSRKAPHLFTMDAVDAVKPEETFGGYTAAELDRMSPQDRLVIANRVEYQRAKNQ